MEFLILFLGILFIVEINIFYNILYFVLIVISISYIIYQYNILYIPLILIIVYSTALVILFGFVIMKNIRYVPNTFSFYNLPISSNPLILLSLLLFFFFLVGLQDSSIISPQDPFFFNEDLISIIGNVLYKDPLYSFLLLVSALLLLFPVIAIVYI